MKDHRHTLHVDLPVFIVWRARGNLNGGFPWALIPGLVFGAIPYCAFQIGINFSGRDNQSEKQETSRRWIGMSRRGSLHR